MIFLIFWSLTKVFFKTKTSKTISCSSLINLYTIESFTWHLILFSYLHITTVITKTPKLRYLFLIFRENMVVSVFTKQVHLFSSKTYLQVSSRQMCLCSSTLTQFTTDCPALWHSSNLNPLQICPRGLASLPHLRKSQVGIQPWLSCGNRFSTGPRCCQVLTTMPGIFKKLASHLDFGYEHSPDAHRYRLLPTKQSCVHCLSALQQNPQSSFCSSSPQGGTDKQDVITRAGICSGKQW